MNIPTSVQNILESIEALSDTDKVILFEQLRQIAVIRESKSPEEPITDRAIDRLSEEIPQTTDRVLLQQETDGTISATLLGWSDCQAFGKTRDEAVRELRELVSVKLARAEIVPVRLISTQSVHPLLSIPVTLSQNPLFDEVVEYMENYRRELDAETEVSELADYQLEPKAQV
jgi:predicted RNase H-like HicB family nuclease